ncbi:hypothetical protein RvY_13068 [Ramazzottius varieornatus]|uniref:Vacuolar protein-sorting-associated protein 36 n=1 Tax=Ramazzottius varieornatus TaxID=947166 RepID=A0A1D1VLM0_RAMVA|nr:hypothetical protein RvY_13068 [Ramazzottius varieornatus]
MNRFEQLSVEAYSSILKTEENIAKQRSVGLYDGEERSPVFDRGILYLTPTNLIWIDEEDESLAIRLHLSTIILAEDQRAGSDQSSKISLHLNPPSENFSPVQVSEANHVKLSFREGGMTEFFRRLSDTLMRKRWETVVGVKPVGPPSRREMRTGISGIEKTLQAQQATVNIHISKAFEDLSNLMTMAKDTVNLTKNLVSRLKNKQGEITEDETTQLKSYLLSLGVDDPVTRDAYGNDNSYYRGLAIEVSSVMSKPLKEKGGLMTLTDVYVYVNRARGFELVSPEDLLRACRLMESLRLPTKLKVFDSGVVTLELSDLMDADVVKRTKEALDKSPLTPEMLSREFGISVVLAREMLLLAEARGAACRDESIEGLRFFPNKFVLSK